MSVGVYINMELPKSCSDCPMLDWDLDYIKCKVTGRHFKVKEEPFGARRVDDCPLISVPEPHGRLIDADALKDKWSHKDLDLFSQGWGWLRDLNQVPTIIPAEEAE